MTHGLDVHVDELLQLRLRQLSEVPADPPSVSAHKHAGRDTRPRELPDTSGSRLAYTSVPETVLGVIVGGTDIVDEGADLVLLEERLDGRVDLLARRHVHREVLTIHPLRLASDAIRGGSGQNITLIIIFSRLVLLLPLPTTARPLATPSTTLPASPSSEQTGMSRGWVAPTAAGWCGRAGAAAGRVRRWLMLAVLSTDIVPAHEPPRRSPRAWTRCAR